MADVRALLAAEKQSRRISHPHLTYTKAGALTCNVCNLNVKSEQLWPGHLKSANHRKNAQKLQETISKPLKRKLDDVDDDEQGQGRDYEVDNRKKPKATNEEVVNSDPVPQNGRLETRKPEETAEDVKTGSPIKIDSPKEISSVSEVRDDVGAVDEDEWAAFERDIKPLAQADYEAATITAAPVSASAIAAQEASETKRTRDQEADDEKEDESRRMEEEFDVMEEMEERVRKLREKREALRQPEPAARDTGQVSNDRDITDEEDQEANSSTNRNADDDESDDETDDWYA